MPTLRTLPGDDVRQIMWRYSERFDLQMAVASVRATARGLVAKLVAEGVVNTHEWTNSKDSMLKAFDECGLTAIFMDQEQGGFIEGPKNTALALVAFELAWVDAGAATCALAGNLGLSPIHEKGTPEQRTHYMNLCAPRPGEEPLRAAFALTEPLPYVGVDTGILAGKVRIAEWKEGEEPVLQVEKRGRFITGMDFADIITCAVDTGDPRIKSSCMVIVESGDPGTFDRGAPVMKMVHKLSSTRDPIINVTVPASRIIGGYTVKDGVIIPKYTHAEIIAAVFHRTRVTVSLMTAAKLLSAIEPVIRYGRTRFRGGEASSPGSPRFELGLQQKEDVLFRLLDVWAMGEAAASLGFCAARLFDALDPIDHRREELFGEKGIHGVRAQMTAMSRLNEPAMEALHLADSASPTIWPWSWEEKSKAPDPLPIYRALDSLASVLCPASKLWNTGQGATAMREAVSLMGGYGITEDCPGFLGRKWMDSQLEATYEGPEAVQRMQLSVTMTDPVFLSALEVIKNSLLQSSHFGGAIALSLGLEFWFYALEYLQKAKDAEGKVLFHRKRQGVTFPMADALCWLLSAACLMDDVSELAAKAPEHPVLAEGAEDLIAFYKDLAWTQAARSVSEAAKIIGELVVGYATPEALEEISERFSDMRKGVDLALIGSRQARERAAKALSEVMIPEALDYPI